MMKRALCLPVAVAVFALLPIAAGADDSAPWQALFNGKDLSGWHGVGGSAANWNADDGMLSCTGERGSQWLRTERQYGSFDLKLEFKIPENGNSGVFVRAPVDGAPHIEGFEIQILDDYGPQYSNLKPEQYTGAIYAARAPAKRATKAAGQWQSMRILLDGRHCAVWVNDEQVIDADLDALAEQFPGMRGLKRAEGYIGLQNHSSPVWYRNIRIREIDD